MALDDDIDRAVREKLLLLARDPERHGELWALAKEGEREFAEVKGAVERLLRGQDEASIDGALEDAFLNELLGAVPLDTVEFDSGAPGGSDQHDVHELPDSRALVASLGIGWSGPYASATAAFDRFASSLVESSLIEVWHSDNFSDDLSAVPEEVGRIEIEGETYHRFEDQWRTDGDGPIYVKFRGTWMSEDDALDAENEAS